MKMRYFYKAFLSIGILFLSTNLYAIGIGAYATGSLGSYEWEYNISNSEDPIIDSTINKKGFGFIMDTNLAYDRLFNYRLQLGYSAINIDNKNPYYDINGNEYHFYNSFGFGIFRSDLVRLWFGPQIGCGIVNAKYNIPSSRDNGGNDFEVFYVSAGLIAGLNFNIGDFFTLGLDSGYRRSGSIGTAEMINTNIGVQGSGGEGFFEVCFVYRDNDTFE